MWENERDFQSCSKWKLASEDHVSYAVENLADHYVPSSSSIRGVLIFEIVTFFFWKKEEEKLSTPCNRFYVPDSSNYPQGNVFSRPHKLAVLFFKEEELVREVKRSSNDNQLIIH